MIHYAFALVLWKDCAVTYLNVGDVLFPVGILVGKSAEYDSKFIGIQSKLACRIFYISVECPGNVDYSPCVF